MKDFEKLDKILWQVLSSDNEPDDSLNRKIINRIGERNRMRGTNKRRLSVSAMVAILIVATSISAFAAWKLLTPKEIAENLGDKGLALAFDGEGAVAINQTQTIGGYKITLMGIVSGKEISDFKHSSEELFPDRTYSVLAISKVDGTPMPEPLDPLYDEMSFLVSPFIKGQHPKDLNIFTMNGAASWFIKDGVMYRTMECDDIEVFSDRGLYIAVMDEFDIINAYKFNAETGEISRNTAYEGINALFDLPIDPSKGNYKEAEKYIQTLLSDDEEVSDEELPEIEELLKDGTLIQDSVQKVVPDEEGMITYYFAEHKLKADINNLFEEGQVGFSDSRYMDDGNILVFSRDDDGSITVMTYRKK
ncbi:hypothetical protein SAMN02745784_02004 [Tissierella praeacuta DSM 18095]|uniref:DUF4179 domain-containing protein n=1 Tax=Tissierella praeacuta DSM 18095 TaxID=1123404 RepID=A0A1M4WVD5_9FIRM|nr:hypothetical protein [Tissierella praeacuta]TCU75793.1 hypothetical protein EV204_103357 [Tissierella praeacuta]SHE85023.1 hypothetical protein SAMN02745784_02004 [Tissierella praeacuta DSM 18095]SUP00448.1 Uncharacterised protein [Tissierella praeacuta]